MPKTVQTIFFGGMGEPLVHKDILEMIRLAAETGADVELLTNGTLLTEKMIYGILEQNQVLLRQNMILVQKVGVSQL